MEGGCDCGAVRYRMQMPPMIVHCCHCRWCQRETGSAFALNAVIESSRLKVEGVPDYVPTPSESGKGQEIARCPTCCVALWSHYPTLRRKSAFVRVGTLDDPATCPPDVHIFTRSKQPWVGLPGDAMVFAEYYPAREGVWGADALARWEALIAT